MARTLLSGIAVAAGTALAFGFGATFGRRRDQSRLHREQLEPLFERLDGIEARVTRAETQAEAEVRLTELRFRDVTASLPAQIEAVIAPRVDDLRQRLRTEMEESAARSLQAFEQSVENRVSSRITVLEDKLLHQSESLADLSQRTSQVDANLQMLVKAVERLCNQNAPDPTVAPVPEPTPEPTFLELCVDTHVKEAVPEPPAPVTAPRVVREVESSQRPRLTLAHVVIAAASVFIGARLAR